MSYVCFSVAVLAAAVFGEKLPNHEPFSQELIDYVNTKPGSTWKAGVNKHFEGVPLSVVKSMMGVKKMPGVNKAALNVVKLAEPQNLPDSFDSRTNWPHCASIREVRDQAACGSCWAFGAVEAMSDRICIGSNGQETPHLSAEDLLTCCKGFFFGCGEGCNGGEPSRAWEYWVNHGIVTGTNFTQHGGCQPYSIPPCDHHTTGRFKPCGKSQSTPSCQKSCISGYSKSYDQDKYYGKSHYAVSSDVDSIKREIMTNGPVEAAFSVYADFPSYKSGVYQHTSGSFLGGHAVRMVGWGVENSVPYWLIANSWNTDWGQEGFFKIISGQDECGIESQIVAGLAKVNQTPKFKISPDA
jgi:cathepsin B